MRIPRTALLIGAVLLSFTAGCAGSTSTESAPSSSEVPQSELNAVQGDRTVTLSVGVGPRTALVHHPASAGAGAPLVLVLHGEGSSAHQAQGQDGWDALADREGFVVAYPDSIGDSWNVSPTCCGQSHAQGVNDAGFLHQLVSSIGKSDFVGRSRVYAVGFSAGAEAAYSWACTLPGELAGVGAVAGGLVIDCPIATPVALAVVQGRADHTVPIDGGQDPRAGAALRYKPLEATLRLFRNLDRCPDQPASSSGPPVAQRSWTCVAGHSVSAAILDDAAHEWPGSTAAATGGEPSAAPANGSSAQFDATDWLWTHLRDARSH